MRLEEEEGEEEEREGWTGGGRRTAGRSVSRLQAHTSSSIHATIIIHGALQLRSAARHAACVRMRPSSSSERRVMWEGATWEEEAEVAAGRLAPKLHARMVFNEEDVKLPTRARQVERSIPKSMISASSLKWQQNLTGPIRELQPEKQEAVQVWNPRFSTRPPPLSGGSGSEDYTSSHMDICVATITYWSTNGCCYCYILLHIITFYYIWRLK